MQNQDYSCSNVLSFPVANNKAEENQNSSDDLSAIFYNSFQENPIPMLIVDRNLTFLAANNSCINTYSIKKEQLFKSVNCIDNLSLAFNEKLQEIHQKQLVVPNLFPNWYSVNIIDQSGQKKTLAIHIKFINSFQDSVISIIDISSYTSTLAPITPPNNDNVADKSNCIHPISNDLVHLENLKVASELAASVSHEIRNPMTAVRGFIQRLGQKKDFANYQSYFSIMLEELDRANQIITEYLSLTKGKTNTIKPENLNTIINQLFPLLQISAVTTNKYLLLDLDPLPDLLLNAKEIRQLLLNLVKNGIEAMESGKSVTVKTYQKANGDINLEIHDQGCGIAHDILDKIGTPFFTTKPTGTGLGLSICYNIAKKNNATIHIDSSPHGTTFTVCFKKI